MARWMRGLVRRHRAAIVAGLAVCLGAAGSSAADPQDVVANCGDVAIRRAEVDAVLRRLGLEAMPAGPQRQRAEATVLEQLIDERILRAELDRRGVAVEDAAVDEAVERLRRQLSDRGIDFDAFLAESGRTAATIRDQSALELRMERFIRSEITEATLAAAFAEKRRDLDGTKLRVSHVLLRPDAGLEGDPTAAMMERAARIRDRIIKGRISFAEAASRHSAGPSRRAKGDLGWIGRDGPMIDAFSSQVFGLAKGVVSRPFTTPFGVHIVVVTEVDEGRARLDAVRPRLQQILVTELIRRLVLEGRQRVAVTFAAGVPHLDPETVERRPDERAVIATATADR